MKLRLDRKPCKKIVVIYFSNITNKQYYDYLKSKASFFNFILEIIYLCSLYLVIKELNYKYKKYISEVKLKKKLLKKTNY